MTVCVCIASRGRPDELEKTIAETFDRAMAYDTHIALALDDDDPAKYPRGDASCRAPREPSLGAKYNRAASNADPATSLFMIGADDVSPETMGWDERLLGAAAQFGDGIGVVYFGPNTGPFCLPEGYALTKGWIDQVGFFCPPYFPYWWHDTWIDELARMTGRFVWADVQWNKHGATSDKAAGTYRTTRMREVCWWAEFFDLTRPMRIETAMRMIEKLDNPPWLKSQLLSELPGVALALERRNSNLRANGWNYEQEYSSETGADLGYDQIKAEAVAMLWNYRNGAI